MVDADIDYISLLVLPKRLQHTFRRRYQTRASEKNIGSLKGFVDLPVDIALEIASYLDIRNLLQLSRLSKQFRSIFTSRSALFIWRATLRDMRIGLGCRAGVNELQLASYYFDDCCTACGRIVKYRVFYKFYLKLCKSCQTVNLVSNRELMTLHPYARTLIEILPSSNGYCFKSEAELILQKFLSLKPESSSQFITNVKAYFEARNI